ncbi:MAG: cellulase family glycosylhydrolase [Planctomycetes bacterium]|nr:cellulase family glycosylhydrolase [Planctomycetota bacterium]
MAILALLLAAAAGRDPLPAPEFPAPCGVNIHFTHAAPGEADLLAGAGFRIVRMDLTWNAVERKVGTFDFSAYDRLYSDMSTRGVRILFILDYGHPVHTKGLGPATDAERAAFVRFASAAAEHFKGKRILWEIWNEPNLEHFWRPKPDAANYRKLAIETAKAIREKDPTALILAPATSRIDLEFMERCFRGGLLDVIDVVTVHPYRSSPPETMEPELLALRGLIARCAPGRRLAIANGEWGYPSVDIPLETQADCIARQQLFAPACGLAFSIWYDWRNDGTDPKEREHHFGTVFHDLKTKPAYEAMKTLAGNLAGFRFVKRLAIDPPEVVALLFADDEEERVAVWSVGEKREVTVAGQEVVAASRPVYVIPKTRSEDLALERGLIVYDRWPEVRAADRFTIRTRFENPLGRAIRIRARILPAVPLEIVKGPDPDAAFELPPGGRRPLAWTCALYSRDREAIPVDIEIRIEGRERPVRDRVTLIVPNTLHLSIHPFSGTAEEGSIHVGLSVGDHSGFTGTLRVASAEGVDVLFNKAMPIELVKGIGGYGSALGMGIPCRRAPEDGYSMAVEVADAGGRTVAKAYRGFRRGFAFAGEPGGALAGLRASTGEGDAKVPLEAMLTADRGRDDALCARLTYRFGDGWRYIPILPAKRAEIPGRPDSAFVWVEGDGTGDALRLRFVDATGQVFQPDGGNTSFKGWRRVDFPMRGALASWGGAKDGVIHYPIRWDAILLIDSASRKAHGGEIRFSEPTLVYEEPDDPAAASAGGAGGRGK